MRAQLTCLLLVCAASTLTLGAPAAEYMQANPPHAAAILKQTDLEEKEALSRRGYSIVSYENNSNLDIKAAKATTSVSAKAVTSAQRYEKVTDLFSSLKQQTLLHISLDNGQTLQSTAGHPFKTADGWRDAVLLKKGGQLLLKN